MSRRKELYQLSRLNLRELNIILSKIGLRLDNFEGVGQAKEMHGERVSNVGNSTQDRDALPYGQAQDEFEGIGKFLTITEKPRLDELQFMLFGSENTPMALAESKEWRQQISEGRVPGYSVVDKFGQNPLITAASDPEDIWEYGGLYPFSTTADIVSLSSSSAADTQDINILGIDATGEQIEQTITLQGQTRVPLTTALWRVYRMENEADAGNDLNGIVYCYSGTTATAGVPSGGSVVKAIIDNGNNQTQMALYTIPKGYVGFLYEGELGMRFTGSVGTGTQYATLSYRSRRQGKVFKNKKSFSVVNNGSSNFFDVRSFPDIIPAYTDIILRVEEVSDDMGIWGTFDILLVEEDKIPSWYLTAIGQPTGTPY